MWGWDEVYGWVESDDFNEWGQPIGWDIPDNSGEYEDSDNDDNECEGHESLAGQHMGETVYCDGSCFRH